MHAKEMDGIKESHAEAQSTQRKNLRALCVSACDSYCQDVAFRVRWLGIGRIAPMSLLCA